MSEDDNRKNIIDFSELKKRKALNKRAEKEEKKAQKRQKALEDKYRAEYRAARARELSAAARHSANGSTSFINWHKIPPFTRFIMAVFLLVQIIMSLFVNPINKIVVIYYFGFVPAMYIGGVEWSWSALIAPFSTLIIHSGWMHLAFNIVMMMIVGIFFEREFGARKTAIFFILCGMAGNLTYFLLNFGSSAPVIGASGAISGLFAVTFMIMIERGLLGSEIQRRGSLPFILLWTTIIIALGLISSDTSWQSHIGGFLGGVGIFTFWKKRGLGR